MMKVSTFLWIELMTPSFGLITVCVLDWACSAWAKTRLPFPLPT